PFVGLADVVEHVGVRLEPIRGFIFGDRLFVAALRVEPLPGFIAGARILRLFRAGRSRRQNERQECAPPGPFAHCNCCAAFLLQFFYGLPLTRRDWGGFRRASFCHAPFFWRARLGPPAASAFAALSSCSVAAAPRCARR